jgi:hypothetical protein
VKRLNADAGMQVVRQIETCDQWIESPRSHQNAQRDPHRHSYSMGVNRAREAVAPINKDFVWNYSETARPVDVRSVAPARPPS